MGRRRVEGSATAGTSHSPTTAPINGIAHNPRNVRYNYDDVVELTEAVRQYGVLQPLGIVRYEIFLGRYPQYEAEIGTAHWVVLHGNRRLAAAHQAGLTEVPVRVHENLGREDVLDESILIENVHRTDLPPLREAALLQELVTKYGSQRKLATKLALSQGYISQRISLLSLIPELQDLVARTMISVDQARSLARRSKEHQENAYNAGPPYTNPEPDADNSANTIASQQTSNEMNLPGEGVSSGAVSTTAGAAPGMFTPDGTRASDPTAGNGEATQTTDYDVISTNTRQTKRKLPEPSTLAATLNEEYTPSERAELIQLLQP